MADFIVGNDISSYQGDPDFNLLVKNANFVMIKATEGSDYVNPNFQRDQSEARRVGLARGYYHFARPSTGTPPAAEVTHFLNTIGNLQEGEVLALDYEDTYTGDIVQWCKTFLDTVLALTGVHALIYLNKSLVRNNNWQAVADEGYGLWLACYDNNLITGAWRMVDIQQWTNAQVVPGLPGKVDGDYFFGTVEQFKLYGYHKPEVPGLSPSPSISPSHSVSPSFSPSSSISASDSPSSSLSASPSPSSDIPTTPDEKLIELENIIYAKWAWFGTNGWINRLHQLKKILET